MPIVPLSPLGHERGGVGVHPVTGGWSGGPDRSPRPCGGRPHEIDHLPLQIDGKCLPLLKGLDHPFMGRVARHVHHPREKQFIARVQGFHDIIGQGKLHRS